MTYLFCDPSSRASRRPSVSTILEMSRTGRLVSSMLIGIEAAVPMHWRLLMCLREPVSRSDDLVIAAGDA
jgi:hypothetical protein